MKVSRSVRYTRLKRASDQKTRTPDQPIDGNTQTYSCLSLCRWNLAAAQLGTRRRRGAAPEVWPRTALSNSVRHGVCAQMQHSPAVARPAQLRRLLQAHQSVLQRPEPSEHLLNAFFKSVNAVEDFDLLVPDEIQILGYFSEGFQVIRHTSSKGSLPARPMIIQPPVCKIDSILRKAPAGPTILTREYIGGGGGFLDRGTPTSLFLRVSLLLRAISNLLSLLLALNFKNSLEEI